MLGHMVRLSIECKTNTERDVEPSQVDGRMVYLRGRRDRTQLPKLSLFLFVSRLTRCFDHYLHVDME